MAKIKHTKNELKAQREALRRFQRFLPMLLLKKQQLQAEIQSIDGRIAERDSRLAALRENVNRWIRLFADPSADTSALAAFLAVEECVIQDGNIAGVNIPVLERIRMRRSLPDLHSTPTWFDDALDVVEQSTRLRIERDILNEQRRLIAEELRVTSQRVNLFEKVKIPECRENIRVIKIFLGDEQTASVVRGKIAKGRTLAVEDAALAATSGETSL